MGALGFKQINDTGKRWFARIAMLFYRACQRLYPHPFRDAFGQEMQMVFALALEETGCRGWRALWTLILREFVDYPACLWRAHLAEYRSEEETMSRGESVFDQDITLSPDDDGKPSTWKEAFLAALPFIAVGVLSGGLGLLKSTVGQENPDLLSFLQPVEIALAILFALSIPAMIFRAWRQGWPRWSATWLPFLLVSLLVLASSPFQSLGFGQAQTAVLYVILPLTLVVFLVVIGQQDRLRSLLAALPILVVLDMLSLEFTLLVYRNLVSLLVWLLAGLVAAFTLRQGRMIRGLWLGIGLSLLVGLLFSWARTFHNNIPLEYLSGSPTIGEFFSRAFWIFLSVSTLLVAPLLVWSIRQLGLRSGRSGIAFYRLAVLGLFLQLLGYLSSFWWHTSVDQRWFWSGMRSTGGLMLTILTYLGVLLYMSGMALLAFTARQKNTLPGALNYLVLAILPLAFSLMGASPMLFNFSVYPPSMPIEVFWLRGLSHSLLIILGSLCILAGCWAAAKALQPTLARK